MLIIISDLHLGDGTTADSISPSAFRLFARRLTETARFASIRRDGKYAPIKEMDILLLGDILDPLHSTLWLDTHPGDSNYIRPWSDPGNPNYAPKLFEVTRAILDHNETSMQVLRRLASGAEIRLAPATSKGVPDFQSSEQIPIKVRIHYLVGNHDWYYHLKGAAFDEVRSEVIQRMGLSNPVSPFPYEAEESPFLVELLEHHRVYARHGDMYDKLNFNKEKGRDHGTVGDAFTMDVCNRFPLEVQKRYGDLLPAGIVDSLRKIANIRPVLAAPLWISGQIRHYAGSHPLEDELKGVWDDIADEFLQLDFVREEDKAYRFDVVDAMELIVKISGRASFATINDVVVWVRKKMWGGKHSFSIHALKESVFLSGKAQHIVYGHTHYYEVIPLGMKLSDTYEPESQIYFNAGTWHSYYDLAIQNPKEQKFVPYQALTYLTFYTSEEHDGRRFETWSGAYA
jgi:UDP-2,3-diacylglucosamine pyrophosphatase LpxH